MAKKLWISGSEQQDKKVLEPVIHGLGLRSRLECLPLLPGIRPPKEYKLERNPIIFHVAKQLGMDFPRQLAADGQPQPAVMAPFGAVTWFEEDIAIRNLIFERITYQNACEGAFVSYCNSHQFLNGILFNGIDSVVDQVSQYAGKLHRILGKPRQASPEIYFQFDAPLIGLFQLGIDKGGNNRIIRF